MIMQREEVTSPQQLDNLLLKTTAAGEAPAASSLEIDIRALVPKAAVVGRENVLLSRAQASAPAPRKTKRVRGAAIVAAAPALTDFLGAAGLAMAKRQALADDDDDDCAAPARKQKKQLWTQTLHTYCAESA